MIKVMIVALVLAIGADRSGIAEIDEDGIERRLLYTACASMDLVVESLGPEDSQRIGLTRQAIENAAESRLRVARLFAPFKEQDLHRQQYLYLNVNLQNPCLPY
jgi:hypothetical protein